MPVPSLPLSLSHIQRPHPITPFSSPPCLCLHLRRARPRLFVTSTFLSFFEHPDFFWRSTGFLPRPQTRSSAAYCADPAIPNRRGILWASSSWMYRTLPSRPSLALHPSTPILRPRLPHPHPLSLRSLHVFSCIVPLHAPHPLPCIISSSAACHSPHDALQHFIIHPSPPSVCLHPSLPLISGHPRLQSAIHDFSS
ncbi:hypothetical protein C8R45DRAFT_555477 [Mycena sanguinolenta]|nr:hypothetical protein C8R45DRAFT_555477 [Mycena sanguinolenta]